VPYESSTGLYYQYIVQVLLHPAAVTLPVGWELCLALSLYSTLWIQFGPVFWTRSSDR
jgi:hypothetical protein